MLDIFYKVLTKDDLLIMLDKDEKITNIFWKACDGCKNGIVFASRRDGKVCSLKTALKDIANYYRDGDFIVKTFEVSPDNKLITDKNFYDKKTGELLFRELEYKTKELKNLYKFKMKLEGRNAIDSDECTVRIIYNGYS